MDDPRPESARSRFIDSSREYPSNDVRARAWQREFASEHSAFRSAFDHAAIGMAMVDLDGRFLKVNPSLCQVVGYTEEELLATDFQSITHPDDLQLDLTLAGQLMRGEISCYHMEKRYLHKQGHVIWILLSASIVRDDEGHPCYFVAQIQDITARKAAQDESDHRLRQMERLTETVPRILHVLENAGDEDVYSDVLRILLDAFGSEAGILLRFADNGELVGRYVSPDEDRDSRCASSERCELWNVALIEGHALIDNQPLLMGCGRRLTRSLVAPIRREGGPIGLIHVANATADYDADDLDLVTRIADLIAPVLKARLERDKLTPREAEIMDLIVSGKTQKQIAAELAISVQTAAKHRARVLEKLQVGNDVELVHLAMQMGRLPSSSLPAVRRVISAIKPS